MADSGLWTSENAWSEREEFRKAGCQAVSQTLKSMFQPAPRLKRDWEPSTALDSQRPSFVDRFCIVLLSALGSTWVTNFFIARFLNFYRSDILTALAWLLPHDSWNCSHLGESSVDTMQPCTMSLHAKPHSSCTCVFSCNLPPAPLAEWSASFTWYCGNTGVERIPK